MNKEKNAAGLNIIIFLTYKFVFEMIRFRPKRSALSLSFSRFLCGSSGEVLPEFFQAELKRLIWKK